MSGRVVLANQSRSPTTSRYRSVHAFSPSFPPCSESDRRACGDGICLGNVETINQLVDASGLTYFQRLLPPVSFKYATRVVCEPSRAVRRQRRPQTPDQQVTICIRAVDDDILHMNIQNRLDLPGIAFVPQSECAWISSELVETVLHQLRY